MARILVVEDNPTNLDLMVFLLKSFGHEPLVAHDGLEGLEAAKREKPDLILMDVQMPRMDGREAVRRLKADAELRKIPVVAVTASAMVGDKERVMQSGFDGYISKPIEPMDFVETVEKFLPATRLTRGESQGVELRDPSSTPIEDPHLNVTVLVIEDNEANQRLLETILRSQGHRVLLAGNGNEGLRLLRAERPDLVITDLLLPEMDGYEFLAQVRRDPDLAATRIIVYTASYHDAEAQALAESAGAAEILIKPCEPREIIRAVNQALGISPRAPAVPAAEYDREHVRLLTRRLYEKVSELEVANKALRQSEEKFSRAFRSTPDSIAIASLKDGRYVEVNDGFTKLTGYARQEVIGRTSAELSVWVDAIDRDKMVALLKEQNRIQDFEFRFRTKSGDIRLGLRSAELIDIGGETCVIGITRDITERRQLEQQLRQALKMEAVGQLAGGVAHDFNNLLGVILGYSEILLQRAVDEDREHLEEIRGSAQRAAGLTRQLLAFSRQQILQPSELDLNSVINEIANLLRRLLPENIELRIQPGAALGRVRADRGQIDQVIMNLAVNARDAMPTGGVLILETANARFDENYVEKRPVAKPGAYVMLAVSDNGVGMDSTTQARIFEPFFTTKEAGKGTGLGLATVYGIVKQSEGFIWIYSEPRRGTAFKVYLPRVESKSAATRSPAKPQAPLYGNETILVVEDVASLRNLFQHSLEPMGYTVLTAENGARALEVEEKHRGAIHLLITDVVMPVMSGNDLAARLNATRPETKVLFVTGYTDDAIVHHRVLEAGVELLQKPFGPIELQRRVRKILDSTK